MDLSLDFMTAKEASKKWGITIRRVQALCDSGKIPKATKLGNMWIIPNAPDAWVDKGNTHIGYEISFTKHFYKPVQLLKLSEIVTDIRALDKESEGLLNEILGDIQ